MRSVQTSTSFPLTSVKPLDGLLHYRAYCLEATHDALRRGPTRRRRQSPFDGAALEPFGDVDGLRYLRCPQTGSLFLEDVPEPAVWAELLRDVSRRRFVPGGFYPGLVQSRTDHVYAPKLEWLQDALRLQGIRRPGILELATPPSPLTHLLEESGGFSAVVTVDEMTMTHEGRQAVGDRRVQAAVLLESVDRVDDPLALVQAVADSLDDGGLLFVTGLVCSGFDLAVLGLHNLYLCPPDRTNCFTLRGLSRLLTQTGFALVEVSTPGVLDVDIVRTHLQHDPTISLSAFEQQLLEAEPAAQEALQTFLQQQRLSSFARLVGRKVSR